jgi:hypothetical protein
VSETMMQIDYSMREPTPGKQCLISNNICFYLFNFLVLIVSMNYIYSR